MDVFWKTPDFLGNSGAFMCYKKRCPFATQVRVKRRPRHRRGYFRSKGSTKFDYFDVPRTSPKIYPPSTKEYPLVATRPRPQILRSQRSSVATGGHIRMTPRRHRRLADFQSRTSSWLNPATHKYYFFRYQHFISRGRHFFNIQLLHTNSRKIQMS